MANIATMIGLILLTLATGPPAHAQRSGFRVRLEPMYVRPYGHDQHVLTIHELDLGAQADHKTAVTVDTRSGRAYRAELQYSRGRWTWGVDGFSFVTSQETPALTLAAGAPTDPVRFEVADQVFTSSNPGQVLFYRLLDDTDVAVWTIDLYGIRTLAESPGGSFGLQLGLRLADFDNDYRAVVGVENTNGSRLDASSNYRRLTGPLVGLLGTIETGRAAFDGYIGQSVIMGEVVFDGAARQFTGPFNDAPAFVGEETFRIPEEIAIPITELRMKLSFDLMDHIALGAGVNAAAWWDVGVPPGIVPIPGGDKVLHENTIVFFGLMGVLEIRF